MAQFDMAVEEFQDFLSRYSIPVDIRGYISLDDRSGECIFIWCYFFKT